MLKEDKMVICGGPGHTNRTDKNSDIVTLVTIVTFSTLTHLMP